jgi:transposase
MDIKIVGIDLAKSVFQICVCLVDNSIKSNQKVRRNKLLDKIRQFPKGTLIAMEACGTSHYWGRQFQELGYQVQLIPAQHVKPFVSNQKNDANDALAICEAAFRPNIHRVPVKTIEQQDIKALRCVRSRLVQNRTAIVNQTRSLAGEYGVIFSVGRLKLQASLMDALEDGDNGLSHTLRNLLKTLYDDMCALNERIEQIDRDIKALCQTQPRYDALLSIPGFGPIVTASFMSELGSGHQFKNGRQLSAWCGLVPSQSSSGGKIRLGSITKNGSSELRVLLIHGARAVGRFANKRDDKLGQWFNALALRQGRHKAVVALANKLARIAWKILTGNNSFDVNKAFS